ncbi:hypothetical protein Tco_1294655 [Tanacetum coccineum]
MEAIAVASRYNLLSDSQSPELLLHLFEYSSDYAFSPLERVRLAVHKCLIWKHPASLAQNVPPVFVDSRPTSMFESALVFSYFSMAVATRLALFLNGFLLKSPGRHDLLDNIRVNC